MNEQHEKLTEEIEELLNPKPVKKPKLRTSLKKIWFTTTEMAGIIGYTQDGIKKMCDIGKIPAARINGRYRIHKDIVKKFLMSCGIEYDLDDFNKNQFVQKREIDREIFNLLIAEIDGFFFRKMFDKAQESFEKLKIQLGSV
jgi:excisionase family DNA binding protein